MRQSWKNENCIKTRLYANLLLTITLSGSRYVEPIRFSISFCARLDVQLETTRSLLKAVGKCSHDISFREKTQFYSAFPISAVNIDVIIIDSFSLFVFWCFLPFRCD